MSIVNFVGPLPLQGRNFLSPKTFRLGISTKRQRSRRSPNLPNPSRPSPRIITSANSLEDSKRGAKSQYDNIPDLNQQYLAELNWVERKYGPDRLKKDIVKEAQKSILRPPGATAAVPPTATTTATPNSGQADLSQYTTLRNQLLGNTAFLGCIGLCIIWSTGTLRDVQSFGVGLLGSIAYVYLLSRSVDRLADAARETGRQGGDALQPARIAILVLLVVASAKNSERLAVLPVLFGFFTYKAASLVPLLTGEAFE
eukprot:GFKZ01013628.1.p1 GENE.GFKZ01013628.1~~GFKZ01013628.1.p1  ORF type:complete len:256 (+),score=21.78 GFKZ01013628.1:120-887(+)